MKTKSLVLVMFVTLVTVAGCGIQHVGNELAFSVPPRIIVNHQFEVKFFNRCTRGSGRLQPEPICDNSMPRSMTLSWTPKNALRLVEKKGVSAWLMPLKKGTVRLTAKTTHGGDLKTETRDLLVR